MAKEIGVTRRKFFRDVPAVFTGIVGLGSCFGISSLAFALQSRQSQPNARRDAFLASLGLDRLNLDPSHIANRFSLARTGSLSCYYQLFWPVHRFSGYMKRLDVASAELFLDETRKDRHRLKALPLVARIHALAESSPEESQALATEIIKRLQEFTDPSGNPEFRRRNAAMIIWKNAIAALTRNIESWSAFKANTVADEAARFCEFYLREDYPELLEAAVCAFQFLLTYEKALAARNDATHQRVAKQIQYILDGAGKRPADWFVQFHRLYAPLSSWRQMPPEINEILLGNRAFAPELANFVILLRLAYNVGNRELAEGRKTSPYITAEDVRDSRTPFIFANYGISRERVLSALDSVHMQDDPRLGLPRKAADSSRGLEPALRAADDTHREAQEQLEADRIQCLLPFRQFDEELRTRRLTASLGSDQPLQDCLAAITAGASRETAMHSIWQLAAKDQARQLCQLLSIDKETVRVKVEEEIERNGLSKMLDETFESLRNDLRQQSKTTVAMPSISTVGEVSDRPTEGKLPMPQDQELQFELHSEEFVQNWLKDGTLGPPPARHLKVSDPSTWTPGQLEKARTPFHVLCPPKKVLTKEDVAWIESQGYSPERYKEFGPYRNTK
jgi:hypothetical protein